MPWFIPATEEEPLMPAPKGGKPGSKFTCPAKNCGRVITVNKDGKDEGHADGCSIAHNTERK